MPATKKAERQVNEAFSDFSNGITSSLEPDQLPSSYSSWASNVTFRKGKPRTRPPYRYIGSIPNGRFQGAKYYSVNDGSVVFSVDGRIYRTRVYTDSLSTFEITPIVDVTTTAVAYTEPVIGNTVTVTVVSTTDIKPRGVVKIVGNEYYVSSIISNTQMVLVSLTQSTSYPFGVSVPDGSTVTYVDINSPRDWHSYMEQTGDDMIIQNGIQKAIIYNGSSSYRSTGTQVPTGTRMAFGNGRLWVATRDQVRAGNIYGLTETSHLDFTDDTYLAEGGYFAIPDTVTAMSFLPRLDNTTSTGDLFVFTRDTTTTIQATVYDRTQWKDTVGMQKLLFPALGAEGQRSITHANQDLVYESKDGGRTFRNTVIDQQDFSVIPFTIDVSRIKDYDSELFKPFVSMAFFDNRLLMTGEMQFIKYSASSTSGEEGFNVVGKKLLVQDYATIAYAGKSVRQAWEGEWTGLNVMQLVKGKFHGKERLIAFCCNDDGTSHIYEILKDGREDELPDSSYESNVKTPITSYVETRAVYFGAGDYQKRILRGSIYFSKILGDLSWIISYRPDEACNYSQLATGDKSNDIEVCDNGATCTLSCTCEGYSHPARFGGAPDICNTENTADVMNKATKFQFKIQWTGEARLDQFTIDSQILANTAGGTSC